MAETPEEQQQSLWRNRAMVAFVVILGLGAFEAYRLLDPPEFPVQYEGGRVIAAPELASVLWDPSVGPEKGIRVQAIKSTADGRRCQQFIEGNVSGVACLTGGDWRLVEMRQSEATEAE